jgi:hypothetical protein
VLCSGYAAELHVFEGTQDEAHYLWMLEHMVLPHARLIRRRCGKKPCYVEDGASAHTAKRVIQFRRRHTVDYELVTIKNRWKLRGRGNDLGAVRLTAEEQKQEDDKRYVQALCAVLTSCAPVASVVGAQAAGPLAGAQPGSQSHRAHLAHAGMPHAAAVDVLSPSDADGVESRRVSDLLPAVPLYTSLSLSLSLCLALTPTPHCCRRRVAPRLLAGTVAGAQ